MRAAKSAWVEAACKGVSDTTNPKQAWDDVKRLRAGLAPARRAPPAKMKKADGSLAQTAEENAEVHAEAFGALYGRTPEFDESVLDALPQKPVTSDLDHEPTLPEVSKAISQLHDSAPGDSGRTDRHT